MALEEANIAQEDTDMASEEADIVPEEADIVPEEADIDSVDALNRKSAAIPDRKTRLTRRSRHLRDIMPLLEENKSP